MLAEMAAINAAYGVIKEVVGNGRELFECGHMVAQFFEGKHQLQRRINARPADKRSDLEEFFALEELKQREQELKELMIYQGRPGLWDDWLRFQAEAARARRQEAAEVELAIAQRRDQIIEWLQIGGISILFAVAALGALGLVFYVTTMPA